MVRRANGQLLFLEISILVIFLVVLVAPARAAESMRLTYVRGLGADLCPDERALRLAVAVRLGYDPFVAWAPKTVHAEVARAGSKLRARVYLADGDGRARGSRDLSAPLDDCDKLLAAVALAISIAVDPMNVGAPSAGLPADANDDDASPTGREDRPNLAPAVAPNASERAPTAPERPEAVVRDASRGERPSDTMQWFGGLGTLVASGTAPDLAAAIAAFARVGWKSGSLAVEGRYHLPASMQANGGRGAVEARLYLVSLEPCLRFSPLALCGLATVGSLQGAGEGIVSPLQPSTLYWGLGGRAAFEIRLLDPVFVRAHFDLVGNATRVRLEINGTEVWRAPPLAAAAGIDAVAQFW
jgi:hypothetical protein